MGVLEIKSGVKALYPRSKPIFVSYNYIATTFSSELIGEM